MKVTKIHKSIRFAIFFSIVIISIFLFSYYIFHTNYIQHKFKDKIKNYFENRFSCEINIDSITVNVFREITLKKIDIIDNNGNNFFSDSIYLNYSLFDLLFNKISINQLILTNSSLKIINKKDKSNFTEHKIKKPKSNYDIYVDNLSANNLQIIAKLKDEKKSIDITKLNLKINISKNLAKINIKKLLLILGNQHLLKSNVYGDLSYNIKSKDILLEQLKIKSKKTNLILNGKLNLTGKQSIDIKTNIKAFSLSTLNNFLPYKLIKQDANLSGKLFVNGNLKKIFHRLNLYNKNTKLNSKGYIENLNKLNITGSINNFNLENFVKNTSSSIKGRLSTRFAIKALNLKSSKRKYSIKLNLSKSKISNISINSGLLNIYGNTKSLSITNSFIQTSIDKFDLSGNLTNLFNNKITNISNLQILSKYGNANIKGLIKPNKNINLEVNLPNISLSKLQPLINQFKPNFPQINGNLKAFAKITGTYIQPIINSTINGEKIKYKNLFLEKFNLETKISTNKALFNLIAKQNTKQFIKLNGHINNLFSPNNDQNKNITISSLSLNSDKIKISNPKPIIIKISKNRLTVSPVKLVSDTSYLLFDADIDLSKSKNTESKINLNLGDINLAMFNWLFPKHKLKGLVNSNINLSGKYNNPVISANLSLKDFFLDKPIFSNLSILANYKNSNAKIKAIGIKDKKKVVDIDANAKLLLSLMPFSYSLKSNNNFNINFKANNLNLSALPLYRMSNYNVNGLIDADLKTYGNYKDPKFKGYIQLKKGALDIKNLKLQYKDINGKIKFNENKVYLDNLKLKDKKNGDYNLSGSFLLKNLIPSDLNIKIKGKNCFFQIQNGIHIFAQPNLLLTGNYTKPLLTGNINITKSRVYLDLISQSTSEEEITIVNDSKTNKGVITYSDQKNSKNFIKSLAANINVIIKDDSWIKNQSINFEVTGKLNLQKKSNQPFLLQGSLNSTKGTYEFQGNIFYVDKGEITFIGFSNQNPTINFSASIKIHNVTILLKIMGTTNNLQVTLDSIPKMEKDDIVSYLFYGKPSDELRNQEQLDPEKAAISYSGQFAFNKLKQVFGDKLPLDTLYVDGGSGNLDEGSVTIGKYLTPDIYLKYQQGFNVNNIHNLTIIYDLNQNFSIEGQLGGETDNGIDLIWQYNFD